MGEKCMICGKAVKHEKDKVRNEMWRTDCHHECCQKAIDGEITGTDLWNCLCCEVFLDAVGLGYRMGTRPGIDYSGELYEVFRDEDGVLHSVPKKVASTTVEIPDIDEDEIPPDDDIDQDEYDEEQDQVEQAEYEMILAKYGITEDMTDEEIEADELRIKTARIERRKAKKDRRTIAGAPKQGLTR